MCISLIHRISAASDHSTKAKKFSAGFGVDVGHVIMSQTWYDDRALMLVTACRVQSEGHDPDRRSCGAVSCKFDPARLDPKRLIQF
ncbi:UNVERIFIED_ORG: hypothetical protein J2W75_004098 [Methylorubrum zatmanii]|uniref:hypothetical protein n=1 Tax=Methylorubrum extorquens TaxID=408 RepID=UPI00209E0F6A|nr:hypothetical protein [Methylorubrum extorquens]MCP1557086.1 hypothetical protein [Methylorubrum extorquens]